MATYTLHVPADSHWGDARALDRALVVKDGFTWGAFVFTFLWFLANRLWLAALLVFAAEIALAAGAYLLNLNYGAAFVAELLLGILIGLEASSLKRWTLARRGRPVTDVVTASGRDEAETRAFTRWLSEPESERSLSPPAPTAAGPGLFSPAVIGLFPEAEPRR